MGSINYTSSKKDFYAKRKFFIFDKIELDINYYGEFADKSIESLRLSFFFCPNKLFPSLKCI